MSNRRLLCLWFPRFGAEHLVRLGVEAAGCPLATIEDRSGSEVLASLSVEASRMGLHSGQPLREALLICPNLRSYRRKVLLEKRLLSVLRRWAERYSPWIAEQGDDGLVIDITGCSHLFGGEAALFSKILADCAALGFSARIGIADTLGAAWALAHYAGGTALPTRSGDGIASEARATRSRASNRPAPKREAVGQGGIAASGESRAALAPLPLQALRLRQDTLEALARLGLRHVEDLYTQPRVSLARRFGTELILRLDQALGVAPEPISPVSHSPALATRLSFPEPVAHLDGLLAGIDKMLPHLCDRLHRDGLGARVVRFEAYRADGGMSWISVTLARPTDRAETIRSLLALKVGEIEAGLGVDMLRLVVQHFEKNRPETARNPFLSSAPAEASAEDLLGRLGARLGPENVTRLHPGESHLPESAAITFAAAWSEPCKAWPTRPSRPLILWRPEQIHAPGLPQMPAQFRWRRREHKICEALGPERISPEWWFDHPEWRSGQRDYWEVVTDSGERLWLFYAYGAETSAGWFCSGSFQ